ncbi:unnamed protein product [Urochloa humidicola]
MTQRPAESNAGGVANEKRLRKTVVGEEKKPVAAAGAARIAMAPLPSVTLALFSTSPVIRKGAEPKEARQTENEPTIACMGPTFQRGTCGPRDPVYWPTWLTMRAGNVPAFIYREDLDATNLPAARCRRRVTACGSPHAQPR